MDIWSLGYIILGTSIESKIKEAFDSDLKKNKNPKFHYDILPSDEQLKLAKVRLINLLEEMLN